MTEFSPMGVIAAIRRRWRQHRTDRRATAITNGTWRPQPNRDLNPTRLQENPTQ